MYQLLWDSTLMKPNTKKKLKDGLKYWLHLEELKNINQKEKKSWDKM